MKVLGIVFRESEYEVNVAFSVPGEECFFALAGQESWPLPDASCASPHGVSGTLSGVGNTPEGDTYVGVTIAVAEGCYSGIELGMEWQFASGSCL